MPVAFCYCVRLATLASGMKARHAHHRKNIVRAVYAVTIAQENGVLDVFP